MLGILALNSSPFPTEDFAEITVGITQAFSAMDVGSSYSSQDHEVFVSEETLLEQNLKDHGLVEITQQYHEAEEDGKEVEEEEEEVEEENGDFEFSFVSGDPNASPISADDIFFDGQIRPMFPLFNRDLLYADTYAGDSEASDKAASPLRSPLRKLFVEKNEYPSSSFSSSSESDETEGLVPGTYCLLSEKTVEASSGACKKSNSTGFSKLWRFRDLVHRSNSDGKDAFVFLDPSAAKAKTEEVERREKVEKTEVSVEKKIAVDGKVGSGVKVKGKGVKEEKKMSAHESYIKNRALREGGRRKSYIPYRHVGFFTSVNGFSRNVHPF